MSEIEHFETHMDRMERERQAQQAALAVEQEKTRRAKIAARADTKETFLVIICSLIAAVAVLGFTYIIWQANAGPSESQRLEDKWRTECIEASGTWIPDMDGADDHMCVGPSGSIDRTDTP